MNEEQIYKNIIASIRDYANAIYLDPHGSPRSYEVNMLIKEHLQSLAESLEEDLL